MVSASLAMPPASFVPPKVEYSLTPIGRRFLPVMDAMCAWGVAYLAREEGTSRNKKELATA